MAITVHAIKLLRKSRQTTPRRNRRTTPLSRRVATTTQRHKKSDAATTAKATAWSHGHSSHATPPQSAYHGHGLTDTRPHLGGHDTATPRPRCSRDHRNAPTHVAHNTPNVKPNPPWGSLPPGTSAKAGGTIAEIARGFLKSSRTKRDACKLPSRSAHGLQSVHNHVVQPLSHPFC